MLMAENKEEAHAARRGEPKVCPIGVCLFVIPRHMLMCGKHWRLVPAPLQRTVYSSYRSMMNGGGTKEWLAASDKAIDIVNNKTGR